MSTMIDCPRHGYPCAVRVEMVGSYEPDTNSYPAPELDAFVCDVHDWTNEELQEASDAAHDAAYDY